MRWLVLVLAMAPLAARAQSAGDIAQGLASQPLAYISALALLTAGWLARALLAEKDARLAQALAHAEALAAARSEGALLARQLGDGLTALEDVMQHMTRG